MRISKLTSRPYPECVGVPPTKRTTPPIIFVGSMPTNHMVCGYLAGAVTTTILMDYLAHLAIANRYYHTGNVGVYAR
jgi:hypothetical protein